MDNWDADIERSTMEKIHNDPEKDWLSDSMAAKGVVIFGVLAVLGVLVLIGWGVVSLIRMML